MTIKKQVLRLVTLLPNMGSTTIQIQLYCSRKKYKCQYLWLFLWHFVFDGCNLQNMR